MAKTIRVKMNNTESGRHADFEPNGQFHCLDGHEYEVPSELAESWIHDGIASRVKKQSTTPAVGLPAFNPPVKPFMEWVKKQSTTPEG